LVNPFLLFIALFVWIGAGEEASMTQMKTALGGIPVSRAMITDFRTLTPRDPLARAVEYILAGFQQDFPVVQDNQLVGILTRGDVLTALAEQGQQTPVEGIMQRHFETADPAEMLESAFTRLQHCNCHSLPVVRGGHIMGIVTMENVGEFLMIQAALRGQQTRGG
jgi:CBS domain-containing protein